MEGKEEEMRAVQQVVPRIVPTRRLTQPQRADRPETQRTARVNILILCHTQT